MSTQWHYRVDYYVPARDLVFTETGYTDDRDATVTACFYQVGKHTRPGMIVVKAIVTGDNGDAITLINLDGGRPAVLRGYQG